MDKKAIDRRAFIAELGFGLGGAGLLLNQLDVKPAFGLTAESSNKRKESAMGYRTFGKTGLKVSEVSLGAMRLKEPAVMLKALDPGVNFIDTAHSYQNGNNEKMIGKVAKEYGRKKMFIATKVHPFQLQEEVLEEFRMLAKKTLNEKIEESLKRLQTDYVDVLYIHNVMDKSWPQNQEVLAFLEKVKKEGKARFVGISIHDPRCYVEVDKPGSQGTYL